MRRRSLTMSALLATIALVSACTSTGDDAGLTRTGAAGEPGVAVERDAARAADGSSADGPAAAGDRSEAFAEVGGSAAPGPSTTVPAPPEEVSAVTAGSVDDNEAWDAYLVYRQWFDALTPRPAVLDVPVEGRQVITVTDEAGRPVQGAVVEVADEAGTVISRLTTYGDGRALFHAPLEVDPDSQDRPRYRAVASGLGASAELEIDVADREHVVALPAARPEAGVPLDVVFLLDATGSMADEIDRLKATIRTVSDDIAGLPGASDLRFGLTAYRDVGDEYVTRSTPLTGDLASFSSALDEVEADGGGDRPEALEEGFHEVVGDAGWRDDAMKVVFVVADAPPHVGGEGPAYDADVIAAAEAGIKVFPIASSGLAEDAQGEYVFRQLAQITMGRFVFLTYGADGVSPGEGTEHRVDPGSYAVLPLDELVVRLVGEELAPQT